MATCKTAFCEKEGKVAGYCAQCYPAAKAAGMLDDPPGRPSKKEPLNTPPAAEEDPVCKGGCGKKKSEVKRWVKVRGKCNTCDARQQWHERYKHKNSKDPSHKKSSLEKGTQAAIPSPPVKTGAIDPAIEKMLSRLADLLIEKRKIVNALTVIKEYTGADFDIPMV